MFKSSVERRKLSMSALICVILLAISAATKNATILLAAGLFAIAAEIAYKDKDWYLSQK